MSIRLKAKLCDSVFNFAVGTVFVYAMCISVMAATVLEPPGRAYIFTCAGFVILLSLVFYSRRVMLISLGCVLTFCLWAAYCLWRGVEEGSFLDTFLTRLEEMALFARGFGPYRPEYGRISELWLAAGFSLIAVINTQVHYGFYTLSAVAVLVLGLPVLMPAWGRSGEAAVLMALCFLAMLAAKLYRNSGRSVRLNPLYILALIPLSLIVFGLAWITPKPDTETVSLWTGSAAEFFSGLPVSYYENRAVTFSEDGGTLGGPTGLGDEVVMTVRADEGLYLSGSVRDSYTGSGWKASLTEKEKLETREDTFFPTYDHPDGLREAQEYYMRYYAFPEREATVTMKAGSLMIFSPPFRSATAVSGGQPLYLDNYGALSVRRPTADSFEYTHRYISFDKSSEYYGMFLSELAPRNPRAGFTEEELAPYLALPEDLPGRVRELAGEITASAGRDYDKLKLIEGYLALRYPYTLDPESVPAGYDFVDWFLFEGKEGYCVYYASAMAVLGRAAGIPTRYVEGYILPEENDNGLYTVTGKQAHAWAEGYIEGFGWAQFEPTAAFYAEGSTDLPIPLPVETSEPEEVSEPQTEQESEQESEPGPRPEPAPGNEDTDTDKATPQAKGLPGWAVTVLVILLIIGAAYLWVYLLIRRYRSRKARLRATPDREAVIILFGHILNASAALGTPVKRRETALAFAGRAGEILSLPGEDPGLSESASIYCRAAYSKKGISPFERGRVERCRSLLTAKLRGTRRGKLRFLLGRYLSGKL